MDPAGQVQGRAAPSTDATVVEGYDISALLAERDAILKDVTELGIMRIFGYGSLVWRPAFPFLQSRNGFVHGYVRRFWQASPDHRGTPESTGRVCVLVQAPAAQTCHGTVFEVPAEQAAAVLEELFVREKAGYRCERVEVHCPPESVEGSAGDMGQSMSASTACVKDAPPPAPTLVVPAITFTADHTSSYWAGPKASARHSSSSSQDSGIECITCVGTATAAVSTAGAALVVAHGGPDAPTSRAHPEDEDEHDPSSPAAVGRVIAFAAGPSGTNLEYFLRLLQAMRARGVRDPHLEELLRHVLRHRGAAGLETPLPDGVTVE